MSAPTGEDPARQALGRALSRLPSGLYVLTAGRGPAATGMLASWVMQTGFAPPTLVVALGKGRPIEAQIRGDGVFCLAVIDEASKALMKHFARGFAPGVDAFEGVELAMSSVGVPYPRAAAAHLACRMRGSIADWSDHVLVAAEVESGDGDVARAPLVHVRKNGFSY